MKLNPQTFFEACRKYAIKEEHVNYFEMALLLTGSACFRKRPFAGITFDSFTVEDAERAIDEVGHYIPDEWNDYDPQNFDWESMLVEVNRKMYLYNTITELKSTNKRRSFF